MVDQARHAEHGHCRNCGAGVPSCRDHRAYRTLCAPSPNDQYRAGEFLWPRIEIRSNKEKKPKDNWTREECQHFAVHLGSGPKRDPPYAKKDHGTTRPMAACRAAGRTRSGEIDKVVDFAGCERVARLIGAWPERWNYDVWRFLGRAPVRTASLYPHDPHRGSDPFPRSSVQADHHFVRRADFVGVPTLSVCSANRGLRAELH